MLFAIVLAMLFSLYMLVRSLNSEEYYWAVLWVVILIVQAVIASKNDDD